MCFCILRILLCWMVLVQWWMHWESVWSHIYHRSVVPFFGDWTTSQLKSDNRLLISSPGLLKSWWPVGRWVLKKTQSASLLISDHFINNHFAFQSNTVSKLSCKPLLLKFLKRPPGLLRPEIWHILLFSVYGKHPTVRKPLPEHTQKFSF